MPRIDQLSGHRQSFWDGDIRLVSDALRSAPWLRENGRQ